MPPKTIILFEKGVYFEILYNQAIAKHHCRGYFYCHLVKAFSEFSRLQFGSRGLTIVRLPWPPLASPQTELSMMNLWGFEQEPHCDVNVTLWIKYSVDGGAG